MTATVTVNRDGVVIGWSEKAVGLLGYPESHAIGRAMDFFIPEEERAGHWAVSAAPSKVASCVTDRRTFSTSR